MDAQVQVVVVQETKPWKRSPCPAEERADALEVAPDQYAAQVGGGTEGYVVGEDGITRQKCGGGHRVIRKKIGGS